MFFLLYFFIFIYLYIYYIIYIYIIKEVLYIIDRESVYMHGAQKTNCNCNRVTLSVLSALCFLSLCRVFLYKAF